VLLNEFVYVVCYHLTVAESWRWHCGVSMYICSCCDPYAMYGLCNVNLCLGININWLCMCSGVKSSLLLFWMRYEGLAGCSLSWRGNGRIHIVN